MKNTSLKYALGVAIGWSVHSELMDPGKGWDLNDSAVIKFAVGAPVAVVPEPSSLALAGLGGVSILLYRRRK